MLWYFTWSRSLWLTSDRLQCSGWLQTAESPFPSRIYSVGQGCVSALYCITQSGKESACVQVCKEGHPSWICCWPSLWVWFGALSRAGGAQHSGCIPVGKVLLCTPWAMKASWNVQQEHRGKHVTGPDGNWRQWSISLLHLSPIS